MRGGAKSIKILIKRKNIKVMGCYFDSYEERDIGIALHFQFGMPLLYNKSVQIKINSYSFDFLHEKTKTFYEYHPVNYFFSEKTTLQYYKERRKILDKNGYAPYRLIVIT
jgi:hypothetical protein